MIISAPLIITPDVTAALHKLREAAALKPVDMPALTLALKTVTGMRKHLVQMNKQTVVIPGPWPFFVTFSIEVGHPIGTCRHMSMSIKREKRVPSPEEVRMVAEGLGFVGDLTDCASWPEDLSDGGTAINVVQPLAESSSSPEHG